MNKSIAVNTPALLSSSADKVEQDKEVGRATPRPFLRRGVFSLVLLRHPPVCLPLTLSSACLPCVSEVCARGSVSPHFVLGSRGFRSDTAQPERTLARRSSPDRQKIPSPPPTFFFKPPLPLPPFLPRPPRPNTLTWYSPT